MIAQILCDGAHGILWRRCPRDLGALRREHGRHQLDQRLARGVRPRRDRAARVSAQTLLDRCLSCPVSARDAEAGADARQHQSAGLMGGRHCASLLCVSR